MCVELSESVLNVLKKESYQVINNVALEAILKIAL